MVWPTDLKGRAQEVAGEGSLTEFTIEAVEAHLKDHTVIRDTQRELDETKLLCQLLADRIVMGGTSTDRLEALMEVEFPSWMDTSGWPSEFAKRVPTEPSARQTASAARPEPGGRPDWVESGEEKASISGEMNPFIPAAAIVAPDPTPEIIAEAKAIAAEHGVEPIPEPQPEVETPAEPEEEWKPKPDGKDDLFARIAAQGGDDMAEVLGKVKVASEVTAPEPKPVEELSAKEAKYAAQEAPEPVEVETLKPEDVGWKLEVEPESERAKVLVEAARNDTPLAEVVPDGLCPKCKQELIDGECWTCG